MRGTVVEDTDIARARTVETVFQTDVVDEGCCRVLGIGTRLHTAANLHTDAVVEETF